MEHLQKCMLAAEAAPYVKTCNHKYMELHGYLIPTSAEEAMDAAMPVSTISRMSGLKVSLMYSTLRSSY